MEEHPGAHGRTWAIPHRRAGRERHRALPRPQLCCGPTPSHVPGPGPITRLSSAPLWALHQPPVLATGRGSIPDQRLWLGPRLGAEPHLAADLAASPHHSLATTPLPPPALATAMLLAPDPPPGLAWGRGGGLAGVRGGATFKSLGTIGLRGSAITLPMHLIW